jgi:AI-2 transport protein TqsA
MIPIQEWMAQNFGEPGAPAATTPLVDLKSVVEQLLTMDSFMSVVNWVNQVNIVPWVIALVTKAFFALIIMVFVLIEAEKFADKVGPMIDARGPNFRRFKTIGRELQYYLAIKTLASLATGILMGLSCWIMGVEFAFAWGLIAFILNFIPTVGALFSAIPPIIVALLQIGFWQGTVLALLFFAIHIMVGNFIEPMVMGRGFGISTVVVILSVLFWGWLWGLVGMFLAVPLTMFIKMMLDESDDFRWIAVAMSKHREEGILELLEAEEANPAKPDEKFPEPTEEEELSAAGL